MTNASFIDRLSEPRAGNDLAMLREGLRRDIEALLNTRRRLLTTPSELEALEGSLLDYGLDDFSLESHHSEEFREEFIDRVEHLVRRFEPRIGRFAVTVQHDAENLERTLRFRITGVVTLGDMPQELQFDSHVDPVRKLFVLQS